jgi:hypothetical protein
VTRKKTTSIQNPEAPITPPVKAKEAEADDADDLPFADGGMIEAARQKTSSRELRGIRLRKF